MIYYDTADNWNYEFGIILLMIYDEALSVSTSIYRLLNRHIYKSSHVRKQETEKKK